MSDLSAFISINCILDNSGASPVIKVVDTSAYPAGVAQTITGTPVIQQPDLISTAAPNITFLSGALTISSSFLRLANNQRFQNGGYTITYTVVAPGYSNTTYIKTFNFTYAAPTQVLAPNFDNFTPKLTVTDATPYAINGFNLVGVNQQWTGVIANVLGAVQNISGAGNTFDVAYQGNYYDSSYDVTLNTIATYTLIASSISVTLVDKFNIEEVFTTEVPPTLIQLLTLLTAYKALFDAAVNNASTTTTALQDNYVLAASIYDHLIERGQNSSLAGLSDYVYQLQKIFNNGVTPPPTNTGAIIPAYNWGASGMTTVSWNNIQSKPSTTIMSWTVGQGGFPLAGSSSATNAGFAGQNVICFRNQLFEPVTKTSLSSTTVNFSQPLVNNEILYIQSIPM